jgi:protein TonB
MPRDLFDDVVHPAAGLGSRRWYTLPLSLIFHTALLAALVIVPLMAADVLPSPSRMMADLVMTPVAPTPPQPPPARAMSRPAAMTSNAAAAPVEAPSGIARETGLVVEPENAAGVEGGVPDGVVGSVVSGLPETAPPPPPAAPIRISQGIRPPTKVKDVIPIYPAIAIGAKVQGVVILEAVIGPDGRVREARVLRSIPLLDQAALEAVRQWEFTPTLLSGVPVPVVMTVTVSFTLK